MKTSRLPEVDVDSIDSEDIANDSSIPINVEEAMLHDSPSEPTLGAMSGRHHGFLSVPANELRRSNSLEISPKAGKTRTQSLCSILSEINSEGSLRISQMSLSGGSRHRKSRPIREIFYREESCETPVREAFPVVELTTLQVRHYCIIIQVIDSCISKTLQFIYNRRENSSIFEQNIILRHGKTGVFTHFF